MYTTTEKSISDVLQKTIDSGTEPNKIRNKILQLEESFEQIKKLKERGYSYRELSDALAEAGIVVAPTTIADTYRRMKKRTDGAQTEVSNWTMEENLREKMISYVISNGLTETDPKLFIQQEEQKFRKYYEQNKMVRTNWGMSFENWIKRIWKKKSD